MAGIRSKRVKFRRKLIFEMAGVSSKHEADEVTFKEQMVINPMLAVMKAFQLQHPGWGITFREEKI